MTTNNATEKTKNFSTQLCNGEGVASMNHKDKIILTRHCHEVKDIGLTYM